MRRVASHAASARRAIAQRPISATPMQRCSSSSSNPNTSNVDIWYTLTDEAPALATRALLPIFSRFAQIAGTKDTKLSIGLADISLAARILAGNPDIVAERFRSKGKPEEASSLAFDWLNYLGELARADPKTAIVKLPNVSASGPQMARAVQELQQKGFNLPDYATHASDAIYANATGSAVNPVLREGNSDRRAASVVKADAMKKAKKLGAWPQDSKTHVAAMPDNDFYGTEASWTSPQKTAVSIVFSSSSGQKEENRVVRAHVPVQEGEVLDAAFMNVAALRTYYKQQMDDAKKKDILLSLHLKATMMKVSDPIMFGHAVEVFFAEAFEKHGALFQRLGVNVRNGAADIFEKLATLPADNAERKAAEADLKRCYSLRPRLAMVDSRKGITNLHVPSDVIVDASMPVVIRDSGKMWNAEDKLEDTKCLIPDRSYAGVYQAVIDDVQKHGQFNPATMGHVSNVGLMAQKAEEYGSHPNTFEAPSDGQVTVVDDLSGQVIFQHNVHKGDIWRMCQTKDAPIRDWVALAVRRARASGDAAIFWLDPRRAHDVQVAKKVHAYLAEDDTKGLEINILPPAEACKQSVERARQGKNTISVTGNVLRDYLTDLFPILELGTSAKMLSIVPLLAGGGVYETGAGGSAPKHVQQFVAEGHLRWDSLGEYLAMAVAFEEIGGKTRNMEAVRLGQTLMTATGKILEHGKSPSRKVGEIDNRGSHFYLALYWAQELAKHDRAFEQLAQELNDNEKTITHDLIACQGQPVDIGGYFLPDEDKVVRAMRPSETFNRLLGL